MKTLLEQFNDPGPEYRGKPFWSWNGELKEDELLRQVHVMKEMGFGGFFMHSRTGLVTEYLGDEWFRLTNACADEAEKLGMEAWLYDEDRCGGREGHLRRGPLPSRRCLALESCCGPGCSLDPASRSQGSRAIRHRFVPGPPCPDHRHRGREAPGGHLLPGSIRRRSDLPRRFEYQYRMGPQGCGAANPCGGNGLGVGRPDRRAIQSPDPIGGWMVRDSCGFCSIRRTRLRDRSRKGESPRAASLRDWLPRISPRALRVPSQGLPFYTGAITYRIPVDRRPSPGQRSIFSVPEFEAACIQVSAPGETPQMIAFQPYQVYITRSLAKSDCIEAEVVLTRRNTFGPLHQVPLKAGAYGPGNFLTEGPGFSEAYRLYPSGLLDEPELLWSL